MADRERRVQELLAAEHPLRSAQMIADLEARVAEQAARVDAVVASSLELLVGSERWIQEDHDCGLPTEHMRELREHLAVLIRNAPLPLSQTATGCSTGRPANPEADPQRTGADDSPKRLGPCSALGYLNRQPVVQGRLMLHMHLLIALTDCRRKGVLTDQVLFPIDARSFRDSCRLGVM